MPGPLGNASTQDPEDLLELLPIVYGELRKLAGSFLNAERRSHTLQPTALVHEAFIKLVGREQLHWQNRAEFFGIATRAMRCVLVDHARHAQAKKRGRGQPRISLEDVDTVFDEPRVDLVELDECLKRLAALDEQQCRIVELKFFAGLTLDEISGLLCLSTATVKRDWTTARVWLMREMTGEKPKAQSRRSAEASARAGPKPK